MSRFNKVCSVIGRLGRSAACSGALLGLSAATASCALPALGGIRFDCVAHPELKNNVTATQVRSKLRSKGLDGPDCLLARWNESGKRLENNVCKSVFIDKVIQEFNG